MHPLQKGFSLIEMLITIGIIGTLSVVGISKFKQSERRGKTLEAKVFLSNLYSNERIYWIEHGKNYHYDFDELVLDLAGKYTYNVGFNNTSPVKNFSECPDSVCEGSSAINFNIAEVCGLTFADKNKECRLVLPGTSSDPDIEGIKGACLTGAKTSSLKAELLFDIDIEAQAEVTDGGDVTTPAVEAHTGVKRIISYTAVACAALKNNATDFDVWSINNKKQLIHEKDGVK